MKLIKSIAIIITICILFSFIYFGICLASGDMWSNIARCIVLIAIGWFSYRTIVLFLTESISEKNYQGSTPILAIVYTLTSLFLFFFFYYSFEEILPVCRFKVLNDLNYYDNQYMYVSAINILTVSALTAFSFNMMKAIFTLNSLEFGLIYDKNLKEVFNNQRYSVLIESGLRFLIAITFIVLENKLSSTSSELLNPKVSDAFSFKEGTSFFLLIGYWVCTLYFFLLVWLGIIFKFLDRERKLKLEWYRNSFWQFILGFMIGGIFILLGYPLKKEVYLISLMAGIVSCLALIFFIIKIEIINLRNGANNNI